MTGHKVGLTINYLTQPAGLSASQANRDWQRLAVCRDHDPEMFFPEPHGRRENRQRQLMQKVWQAQKVCATCPVKRRCFQYAIDQGTSFGIWGGIYFGQPPR